MRKKIFSLLLLCVLIVLLVYFAKNCYVLRIRFEGLRDEIDSLAVTTSIRDISESEESVTDKEDREVNGSQLFKSNTELLNSIFSAEYVSMLSVTAQITADDQEYQNLVTVSEIGDVSFFTNMVDYLLITGTFKKLHNIMKLFSELNLQFNYLDVDVNSKIFTIRVPSVKISGSDISSEFTNMDSEADKEIVYTERMD